MAHERKRPARLWRPPFIVGEQFEHFLSDAELGTSVEPWERMRSYRYEVIAVADGGDWIAARPVRRPGPWDRDVRPGHVVHFGAHGWAKAPLAGLVPLEWRLEPPFGKWASPVRYRTRELAEAKAAADEVPRAELIPRVRVDWS